MKSHRYCLSVSLLLLGACARFPTPYTASELRADSKERAGAALVHYLGQSSADTGVCDLSSGGLVSFGPEDAEDFVAGLNDNRVAPDRWTPCALQLLGGLDAPTMAHMVAASSRIVSDNLERSGGDSRSLEKLKAASEVLEARPRGSRLPPDLIEKLRGSRPSDPAAASIASGLLEGSDMDRGTYRGQRVTAAVVATVNDEATLERLVRRLPTQPMRDLARARIVDLRIQSSPIEWVRAHAESVKKRVLSTGHNAFPGPIQSADYRTTKPSGIVLVEQRLNPQTARLLFRTSETAALPSIQLVGRLFFDVGIGTPVTLCSTAKLLDVTPCVSHARLSLDTPFARLGKDGDAHLEDGLQPEDMLALLRRGRHLQIGVAADGTEVAQVRWPLQVLTPKSVTYGGGKNLDVRVEPLGPRLAIWHGIAGARQRVVVIESSAVGKFRVTTRGAGGSPGANGNRGMDGMSGRAGRAASCPSSRGTNGSAGQPGRRGGDGGPGGPGGRGGNVELTVVCNGDCEAAAAVARRLVRSIGGLGGAGGRGGPGGSGGRGGPGGSGTSCRVQSGFGDNARTTTKSLSGGMDGMRGTDGMQGSNGARGSDGAPGAVTVVTQERPPTPSTAADNE